MQLHHSNLSLPLLLLSLTITAVSALGSGRIYAQTTDQPANDDPFSACLARIEKQAIERNIKPQTIAQVFGGIEQLERVIASDRKQAEFTTSFRDYYTRSVSTTRVEKGRDRYNTMATQLSRITQSSGVPGHYLMAFWGLETNFGGYMGNLSVPSALATLACDARRAEFFTEQLLATLQIVEAGHMQPEQMVGSWAGAMGHMQFMPTTFMEYAQNADADPAINVYESTADALASAGHYLSQIGWKKGERWGREARLPASFPYEQTGLNNWQPLSYWADLGVTNAFGQPLPRLQIPAAVLLPAGRLGPAFVVYENFKIIMQWNRSIFYALSVGRLADRIAGAGRLAATLPQTRFSKNAIKSMQESLTQLGYNTRGADGIIGTATRTALQQFQLDQSLPADGFPDETTLEKLQALVAAKPQQHTEAG